MKKETNWNALIIWKMRTELELAWDIVKEQVPTVLQRVLDGASALLVSLQTTVQEAAGTCSGAGSCGATLVQLVDFKLAKLVRGLDILEQQLLREVECVLLPPSPHDNFASLFSSYVNK